MNSKIVIDFLARTGGLRTGVSEVVGSLDRVQATTKRMRQAIFGVGVGLTGALAAAGFKAASFQEDMQNVNSIVQDTDKVFARTSASVLDLATKIPRSANELAKGAYTVVSAGFTQPKQTLDILSAAGKAASAGLTTVDVAANAVVTALNAYGKAAGTATHVSDLLFQTVNVGQVSFEQLAVNLGDFIGIANAAGASLAETLSAYASITIATGQASRSATSLQGVYRAFLKPSKEMKAALDDIGMSSGKQAIQTLGLQGTLEKLTASVGNDTVAVAQMFQDVEGLNGVLALTGPNAEKARLNLAKFMDESQIGGATQKALAEQAKSFNYQLNQLKSSSGAVAAEFGQVFLPVMSTAASVLNSIAQGLHHIPAPVKTLMSVFGGLTALLATLGMGALLWYSRLRLVHAGLQLLSGTQVVQNLLAIARSSTIAQGAMLMLQRVTGMSSASLLTMGKAAGVAALALLAIGPAADMITNRLHPQHIDRMTDALVKWGESGSYASTQLTSRFGPGLEDLGSKIESFTTKAKKIGIGPFKMTIGTAESVRDVDELDKALTRLVTSGNINQAKAEFKTLEDSLRSQGITTAQLNQAFNDYYGAIADVDMQNRAAADGQFKMGEETKSAAEKMKDAEEEAKKYKDRIKELMQSSQEYTGMTGILKEVDDAQRKVFDSAQKQAQAAERQRQKAEQMSEAQDRMAKAQQKVNDLAAKGKNITAPGTAGYQALADAQDEVADAARNMQASQQEANAEFEKTPASMDQITTALASKLDSYKEFQANLHVLALRGLPIEFLQELQKMGSEGAETAATMAAATPEEFEKVKGLVAEKVRLDSEDYQRELDIQLTVAAGIAKTGANKTVVAILEEVSKIAPGIMATLPEVVAAMSALGVAAKPMQIVPDDMLGPLTQNQTRRKDVPNTAPLPPGATDQYGRQVVSKDSPKIMDPLKYVYSSIADSGAVVKPGFNLIQNKTPLPEYVLTAAQLRAIIPARPTGAGNMTPVTQTTNHNYQFGNIQAQDLTGVIRQADQKKRLQALAG